MAKLHNPFHSLSARGSIRRALTVRRHKGAHVAQVYPTHPDANTPAQQAQRLMFTMCKDLWHTLSQGEKQAWEALARPFHMSGYSYYLSQCLRPNPGIYLPLAGGTMAGVIDMDGNRITNLPAPGASADPTRKTELDAHLALYDGVHGLHDDRAFYVYKGSNQSVSRLVWTKSQFSSSQFNPQGEFDMANDRHQPTVEGIWCYIVNLYWSGFPDQDYFVLTIRRNGTTRGYLARFAASGSQTQIITAPFLLSMNGSSNYAEVWVYHNSSTSETLYSGYHRNFFSGFLLVPTA